MLEDLPALNRARRGIRLRAGSRAYERQLRRLAGPFGWWISWTIAPVPADERDRMAGLFWKTSIVASLSEYEAQSMAMPEALALVRSLVVGKNSALDELNRYAHVRAPGRRADTAYVAAAVLKLLDPPSEEPPVLPT